MSAYAVRPLGRCDWSELVELSGALDGWCWAGHDGLDSGPSAPTAIVPTGWLWAWGTDRWIRWRVDPRFGCVGAELRRAEPTEGWREATVRDRPFRVTVRGDDHVLTWAPAARRAAQVEMVAVVAPAPMTFARLLWTDPS